MTQAIASMRDGHAFQARQFWRKALHLLDRNTAIAKVAFERGPKGFDDIWVEYVLGRGYSDQQGRPLSRQHIQCKWHVNAGEYGYAQLSDPDFINASSTSLLQRARAAQLRFAPDGVGVRFTLLSNWRLAVADPLAKAINQRDGAVRVDRLFDGSTSRSALGKLRAAWCEHLELDEGGLRTLAPSLAFATDASTLLDLRDEIDRLLMYHGMRRVPPQEDACWYDDLTYQWLAQGRIEFDAEQFRAACSQQGLFEKPPAAHISIGVKSFEHPVDHLEDRCTDVLDLVHYFDERPIRSDDDWATTLFPRMKVFLVDGARRHGAIHLILDAHATLAFAAGSILNIKSGHSIQLEQRVLNRLVWHADDTPSDATWPGWTFAQQDISTDGGDLVVAVSLTHDATAAVLAHVNGMTGIGSVLLASPTTRPGNKVIASGRHAFDLAESLALEINRIKRLGRTVHLFIAAPNGFTFFLGQRQPSLGRIALYEYDFEGLNGGGYRVSLNLPISVSGQSGTAP